MSLQSSCLSRSSESDLTCPLVNRRSYQMRVGPNTMTRYPYKMREEGNWDTERHRERRTSYEYGSRNWSDASTRQGMSRTAGSHQKLRERHQPLPQGLQKEALLSGPWLQTSGLQDWERINFSCLNHKWVVLCYHRHRKPLHWSWTTSIW